MVKCSLLVWSEPVAGQEDAYNDWYDNVHLADICSLPGYSGAQRYVFDNAAPAPRKYLAIYDLESDAPESIVERLTASTQEMGMVLSPALDVGSVIMSVVRRV